jgi:hypothetical protein
MDDEGPAQYGPRKNLPNSPTRSRNHPTQKDVKNEDWSSEFIENKGAKKWSSEFADNKQIKVFSR